MRACVSAGTTGGQAAAVRAGVTAAAVVGRVEATMLLLGLLAVEQQQEGAIGRGGPSGSEQW